MKNSMDWVKRLKRKDMTAFDELYLQSKKNVFYAIYSVVRNEDITEDLMQDVYIDFLENVSKLKDDLDPTGYLVTSAKNKALDYYNRNKRQMEFAAKCEPFATSEDKYYDTGLLSLIKETLDEKEFDIFVLRVLGEYSFKEISKIRNIPVGTLTWSFQESRKKLQDKLKGVKYDW